MGIFLAQVGGRDRSGAGIRGAGRIHQRGPWGPAPAVGMRYGGGGDLGQAPSLGPRPSRNGTCAMFFVPVEHIILRPNDGTDTIANAQ